MNQLVSDLSGQDNLNQPCSELTLLPPLCHHDDLPLAGPALHDTDHRYIEEQVTYTFRCGYNGTDPLSLIFYVLLMCLCESAPQQQCRRRLPGQRPLQPVREEP